MAWEVKKLGEVCEVIAGQSPEGKYYNDYGRGLPFYQGKKEFGKKYIGAPTKWTSKVTKEAETGDILMSVRAPVGPINFSTQRVCIGRGLAAIRTSDDIDSEFLFYFLLSKQNEIQGSEGAVFASINKSQIEALPVALSSIDEQKRIVAILDEAFAQIDQAKANAEQNLKNARELFDSTLNQVFNIFEIKNVSMNDKNYLQMVDGDRGNNYPKKSHFLNEGHCLFLSTKNVRPDGFLFNENLFIDANRDKLLRKGKLVRNDVVLTTRGTIGNLALYDESVEFDNIRINSGMLILRPNIEKISPSYLFEMMRTNIIKKQILEKTSGAAQPQLPIKTLETFQLPIPSSLETQEAIVKRIKLMEVKVHELEVIYKQKITALDELKQSLLEKAFSGELTNSSTGDAA